MSLKLQVHGHLPRLLSLLISLVCTIFQLSNVIFFVMQASAAAAVSLAASASRTRAHAGRSPRRRSPSPTARTCRGVKRRRAGSAEGRSALGAPSLHHVSKVSYYCYSFHLHHGNCVINMVIK